MKRMSKPDPVKEAIKDIAKIVKKDTKKVMDIPATKGQLIISQPKAKKKGGAMAAMMAGPAEPVKKKRKQRAKSASTTPAKKAYVRPKKEPKPPAMLIKASASRVERSSRIPAHPYEVPAKTKPPIPRGTSRVEGTLPKDRNNPSNIISKYTTKGVWKYSHPADVGLFRTGTGYAYYLRHKDYLDKDPIKMRDWLKGKPANICLAGPAKIFKRPLKKEGEE